VSAGTDGLSAAVGASFDRMWEELSDIGRDRVTDGYRRFAWSREDAALRAWFTGAALDRRLEVTTDRVGNLWAWSGDPDAAVRAGRAPLVLGSHLDSVPDGGAFDGPLGIVSAFAALDVLELTGADRELTRPLGVVCFADEEGARFGIACAGSRLLTGALDAERAGGLRDDGGVPMIDAMRRAGVDTDHLGRDEDALARIGTYVELHVEQGRGLVDLRAPIAVGSSIRPHGRWRLDLHGRADHAGTARMVDRDDPMLRLATAVVAGHAASRELAGLATIGKVRVEPGAVNAVASLVTAWLDVRGPDEEVVRSIREAVELAAGTDAEHESYTGPTPFDPVLRERLAAVLGHVPVLDTGAGHDAGVLAAAGIETAMLFVRNPTGISHSPEEFAEPGDCHVGVLALATVIAELAG